MNLLSQSPYNNSNKKEKLNHAIMSPSQNAWLNYDEAKLYKLFHQKNIKALGSRLHEFVKEAISLKRRLAGNDSISCFTNDCIKHNMVPEYFIFYSENAFGTADAIYYSKTEGVLKIFDLKTGMNKASFKQLELYACYFLLSMDIKPIIKIILRIYQFNEIFEFQPKQKDLEDLMNRIVWIDNLLNSFKLEEEQNVLF